MKVTSGSEPRTRLLALAPVAFALLPVLILYAGNIGDLHLGELWLPLLVVLPVSLGVWWGCVRLMGDGTRGAVLASLFWVWLFAFGHVKRWFEAEDPPIRTTALLLYGASLLLVAAFLRTTRRDLRHPSGALNVIAVGLLAFQFFTIGHFEMQRAWHNREKRQTGGVARTAGAATRPHIYFIVLDGYAREDVLRDLYHYDNRPFLDFLRRRGFQVASHSRANYCQTLLSVSSCLNLEYLDDIVRQAGTETSDRQLVERLIDDNRTRDVLRAQGYQIAAFPSGYGSAEMPESVAHRPRLQLRQLSDFQSALLGNTPLVSPVQALFHVQLDDGHWRGRLLLWTLDHLASVARSPEPTFVYAHVLSPHPPFVFRHDGRMLEKVQFTYLADGSHFLGTREEYVASYREQLAFLSQRVERLVDDILATAERPTAIVFLSDHGPGSQLDWSHPERSNLRERFGTLVAVRLPEGSTAKLDDDISTVNVMRFVLSQCLGADLPPLPSRSYFSSTGRPYHLTLVADERGQFRRLPAAPVKH